MKRLCALLLIYQLDYHLSACRLSQACLELLMSLVSEISGHRLSVGVATTFHFRRYYAVYSHSVCAYAIGSN